MTDARTNVMLAAVAGAVAIALVSMHPWTRTSNVAGTGGAAGTTATLASEGQVPTRQVLIAYHPPPNETQAVLMKRLRDRGVLEELRDFLAPLRLPQLLTIQTASCGAPNASYDAAARAVTICYELINRLHELIPQDTGYPDVNHDDAVIGAFIDVVLHEVSHALFHILEIPVLGREEDAADQLAALILLQFGEDVARRTVIGALLNFRGDAEARREQRVQAGLDPASDPRQGEFASVHGLPEQRYVNVLCIAYVRYRNSFKEFVDNGDLPQHRRDFCRQEYVQIARAFHTLIEPHIDPVMMQQALKRKWLPSSAEIRQ